MCIVCTPHLSARGGGGGESSLQPNFKKGGDLAGPQLLQGGCWERGGDFFQGGGLQFPTKKIKI